MISSLIGFLIIIGILVFVHELGHYLAAKASDVRVDKFSIGFPPKIWSFEYGETEYLISATPLGGYVRLAGEDPEELSGDPRELHSKPLWVRFIIFAAGPAMNLIFAVVFFSMVFLIGVQVPTYLEKPVTVGWVFEESPAAAAGIEPGDQLTAVDGEPVASWESLQNAYPEASKDGVVTYQIVRNGTQQHVDLNVGESPDSSQFGGISHRLDPVIGTVVPGYPASRAGIDAGDRIVAIDGQEIDSWFEMVDKIHNSAEQPLEITVGRNGETSSVTVTPIAEGDRGLIGISPDQETRIQKFNLSQSLRRGFQRTVDMTVLTVNHIGKLVSGNADMSSLGGPIMIGQAAGHAVEAGATPFIGLMGFISLQLGLLNLLPIPILDGGHIVFILMEGIMGRPVSLKARERAVQVGLIMLALLMIVIFYNDIMRLIPTDSLPF